MSTGASGGDERNGGEATPPSRCPTCLPLRPGAVDLVDLGADGEGRGGS